MAHRDSPEPEQGCMLEGCFRCQLLYPSMTPGRDGCSRCGGTTRFVPAQMMSRELIAADIDHRATAWEGARERGALLDLLEALHVYGAPAREALAARGGASLEDLRRAYEATGDSRA